MILGNWYQKLKAYYVIKIEIKKLHNTSHVVPRIFNQETKCVVKFKLYTAVD